VRSIGPLPASFVLICTYLAISASSHDRGDRDIDSAFKPRTAHHDLISLARLPSSIWCHVCVRDRYNANLMTLHRDEIVFLPIVYSSGNQPVVHLHYSTGM
jgi:hypothetical protein